MRIVTVRARHAVRVHLALQERTVFVDLVFDLAVCKVQILVKQRRPESIGQRLAGASLVCQLGAPCMAARARFDFNARRARCVPVRNAGGRIENPAGAVPGVEPDEAGMLTGP
jgi:hypothetical protein